DLAAAMDAHDVIGGRGELEGVRVELGEAVDDVDLLEHRAHRVGSLERRRHVDRPELPAHPALPQPRNVGVERRREPALVLADVDLGEVVLHPLRVLPGQVVMAVDQRHFAEDAVDAIGNRVGADAGSGAEDDDDEEQYRAGWRHDGYLPSSYRYSTNDITAPSKPCTSGLVESMR